MNAIKLLLKGIIHAHRDVWREGIRLLETIARIQEHRVLLQIRHIRADKRHRDHEGRVLDQHADIAMVGMIVPRPMCDHDVRLPLTNHAGDELAILQGRHQLAIVNIEHLGGYSELLRAGRSLRCPPQRQRSAGFLPVAHITVRDRHQLHMMPQPRPLHRRARCFVLRIIRMSTKDNDAQFAIAFVFGVEGECNETGNESEQLADHGVRITPRRQYVVHALA